MDGDSVIEIVKIYSTSGCFDNFGFSDNDGFLLEFNGYIGFASWDDFVFHFNKDNHGYDIELFKKLYEYSILHEIKKIDFKLLETDSPNSIETINKINLIIDKVNDIVEKINAIQ